MEFHDQVSIILYHYILNFNIKNIWSH